VLDLAGRFVGVLTRQRLIGALKELGPDGRVVDVMIPAANLPVASLRDTLDSVWERMAQGGSRVVAVMDGQKFLGLISLDDISEIVAVVGAQQAAAIHRQPPGAAATTGQEMQKAVDV
jgi:CBS domain-containing protein